VLVALVIIGVALAAAMRGAMTLIATAEDTRYRLLATLAAENRLIELRLARQRLEVGQTTTDCAEGRYHLFVRTDHPLHPESVLPAGRAAGLARGPGLAPAVRRDHDGPADHAMTRVLASAPAVHRPHRNARRGFTLLELLVAISVLAIVSMISWRGLDSLLSIRERWSPMATKCAPSSRPSASSSAIWPR
jgi:prepilin-type N-terminal cleavage/methylation domain-containing protein